nr:putative PIF1 DNA helicase/replication protein A1-like protein [Tanacetum cinerariifolium]
MKKFPPVERLPFHLPNEQSVIFDERDSLNYTLDKASVNETKFQAWMETNKTDTFAQSFFMLGFQSIMYGSMMKRFGNKGKRVKVLDIRYLLLWGEMFYLRVLLNKTLARPEFVYEKTWHVMATDVESIDRIKKNAPELVFSDEQKKNYCLLYIKHMILSNNKSLKTIPNMTYPTAEYTMDGYNRLVHDELSYNKDKLNEEHKRLYVTLIEVQKGIYETIMDSFDKNKGGVFFVYGYGETSKTYLYNTMSAACRSQGGIVFKCRIKWKMQDICRTDPSTPSEQVFMGKVVLFGGDF